VLSGRCKPFRGVTFKGTQRVKVAFPAGNTHGHGNVTGPTLDPTSINGRWSDKYLGADKTNPEAVYYTPRTDSYTPSTNDISTVLELTELFDSIREQGQLIEFVWGSIIRRGYLKSFETKWDNPHDCDWSAEFEWTSKRPAAASSNTPFGPKPTTETTAAVRDRLQQALRVLDAPAEVLNPIMEDYRNVLATIDSSIATAEDSIAGFTRSLSFQNELGALKSILLGAKDGAEKVIDTFEENGWTTLFSDIENGLESFGRATTGPLYSTDAALAAEGRMADAIERVDPDDLFKRQLYVRESIWDFRRLRDEAVARERSLRESPERTYGVYCAGRDETLLDVSERYYGVPSQWRMLMLYNGLSSVELYEGQYVSVPRLTTTELESGS